MPGGFRNQPKVLRGAFVEYGLSVPPLIVLFQFNPLQLSRSRSQEFSVPGSPQWGGLGQTLRDLHQDYEDLTELRDAQQVSVQPESLSFDIRLDATDRLNEGDPITAQLGIAPQLSTLELMMLPKNESIFGQALDALLPGGFSFTCTQKPPMILFIWGRKRVLPVNINSMSITETEFSTDLNPIRAEVAVDLTVIEGRNAVYMYSRGMKEFMSGLHLANLALTEGSKEIISRLHLTNLSVTHIKDVVIPG